MCVAVPAGVMIAMSVASTAVGFIQQRNQVKQQEAAAQAQADSNAAQSRYNAQVSANNAILAERMAKDELDVGRAEEQAHRDKVAQLIGNAKATLASSGFDATAGDAPVLVGDLAAQGELEALTIRRNAANRAAGHSFRAANFTAQQGQQLSAAASFSQPLPKSSGTLALIGAGLSVASKWGKFSQSIKPDAPVVPPSPTLLLA